MQIPIEGWAPPLLLRDGIYVVFNFTGVHNNCGQPRQQGLRPASQPGFCLMERQVPGNAAIPKAPHWTQLYTPLQTACPVV